MAVNCLKIKDYVGAKSALYSLNGCLGDDYIVTISNSQHQIAIQDRDSFQCNHCVMSVNKIINEGEDNEYTKPVKVPTEILLKDVRIYDMNVSLIDSILSNNKSIKVWTCPNCNNVNELSRTKKIQSERTKPFYLKVVPEPPKKQPGVDNRLYFSNQFENWFHNFLQEINYQEVLYRKDYSLQHGHDMEYTNFTDKGDK